MTTPISIVIPAFNQLEYCRQCLDALLAHTRRSYRLVLVDNGSTDGVSEFFDLIPGAHVIHAGTNRGFAGGVNLGLACCGEGHVVLLNSDTLVPEGWLERLETALLHDDDIGMVGPMSNCVSGGQQIDDLNFTSLDEINAFANEWAERNAGKIRETARLVGFCLMIRDRALRTVGLFDESYGIGNFEDDDYCLRVLRAGYRLCVAEDAFVFHYGGRTFMGMGLTDDKWRALINENEQRFHRKWQVRPEERLDAALESKRLNTAANRAAANDDFVEAVRLFKQAIETFPASDANYCDLGIVLCRMGAQTQAFNYFARALKLNSANAAASERLRELASALDRTSEIQSLLEE